MLVGTRTALGLALVFTLAGCRVLTLAEKAPSAPKPKRGMVVCQHPLATKVGVEVLESGGNAADAAVATALALAVVLPQAGNLGGGGFALWVPHEGDPGSFDFRESAPAGYVPALYLDEHGDVVPERSRSTPLAVGVPGSPKGLWKLYRKYGSRTLTFEELSRPAIQLAREGFPVDAWLARTLRSAAVRANLGRDPAASALFYPGGVPLAEGDLLLQPDLANTLRKLTRGPGGFYEGDVARQILECLAAADLRTGSPAGAGAMTAKDLERYNVVEREPVVGWFRGAQVIGMGPPSSGGIVLLQVLAILQGFPLDAERTATLAAGTGDAAGVSARAVHWWIEAMRRAFADRAEHMGDPDQYPVPVAELLAPEWIVHRRVSIGERADPDVSPMVHPPPHESSETTHISVIDRRGNAVSLTTTLNDSFGSGILVPGAGFFLNNELDDFSIRAGTPNMYGLVGGEANQLRPGKRPLSSMSPTIVREGRGRVSIVIGSKGGPRIITAVIQVLLRVLVYGQSLEEAVRAPRLHQQWQPIETRFEADWDPALLAELRERFGHPLEDPGQRHFGLVQAIYVDASGEPIGVSDSRGGGVAGAEGRPIPVPAHPNDPIRRYEVGTQSAGARD